MNAALLYVVRNLLRRRTRTVLGALGIFLTLALLTAIQIGLDSVSISYLDLVALQAGKADLVIAKPGGDPLNPLPFDPAAVRSRLEQNSHLRGLSPRWFGLVQVQVQGEQHYAVLIGLDPQRELAEGLDDGVEVLVAVEVVFVDVEDGGKVRAEVEEAAVELAGLDDEVLAAAGPAGPAELLDGGAHDVAGVRAGHVEHAGHHRRALCSDRLVLLHEDCQRDVHETGGRCRTGWPWYR